MSSTPSSSQGTPYTPSQGITGGYTGSSIAIKCVIAVFASISIYNSIELIALVFLTFTRYKGAYFYSLLIASWGIIPYSLGFLLKFFNITTTWDTYISVTLLTIGWYTMVTGQSVVLWSRLHLLDTSPKTLTWTKWMIIIDVMILHVPTTVLTYGCNGNLAVDGFVRVFNVYEKVQMMGFFLQELVLSSIYIVKTLRFLRSSLKPNTRKLLYELCAINVLIILMDISLVGVEFANQYIIETTYKGIVYSVKLKLEFAVLGKLIKFVTGDAQQEQRNRSVAFEQGANLEDEVKGFANVRTPASSVAHEVPEPRKKSRANVDESDLELAKFEHVEGIARLDFDFDLDTDYDSERRHEAAG